MLKLFQRYHLSLKTRGGYALAWKALVKLLIVGAILVGIFLILQSSINDFNEIVKGFINQWPAKFVLILFLVSESLFGLIPPDFFIAWSHHFTHDLTMLTVLATISYLGGIISYVIGLKIGNHPKVKNFFYTKFASHMHKVYQYGGIIIVFSALFPLPFSMACMAAGAVKYSFKKLLIYGLTRYLRFYVYAIVVWQLV